MKFSYTKNTKSEFFYSESKSNKKKKKILAVGRGGCRGVARGGARVSEYFLLRIQI